MAGRSGGSATPDRDERRSGRAQRISALHAQGNLRAAGRGAATRWPSRIDPSKASVELEGLGLEDRDLASLSRVSFIACGTSWHAALVGKYLDRRVGAAVGRSGDCLRAAASASGRRTGPSGGADLAVGRDGRHAGGQPARQVARHARRGHQQYRRQLARARSRRRALHARRTRNRRGGDQDVHDADRGGHAARVEDRARARGRRHALRRQTSSRSCSRCRT